MSMKSKWMKEVPDLAVPDDDTPPHIPAGWHTAYDIASRTALSESTILDLLSRPAITVTTHPLYPIARPAGRIGPIPLYSQSQFDETVRRRDIPAPSPAVPRVSAVDAYAAGYASLADIAHTVGLHINTIRKWRGMDASFPAPVAARERPGGYSGTPTLVFDAGHVLTWLANHGKVTTGTIGTIGTRKFVVA